MRMRPFHCIECTTCSLVMHGYILTGWGGKVLALLFAKKNDSVIVWTFQSTHAHSRKSAVAEVTDIV